MIKIIESIGHMTEDKFDKVKSLCTQYDYKLDKRNNDYYNFKLKPSKYGEFGIWYNDFMGMSSISIFGSVNINLETVNDVFDNLNLAIKIANEIKSIANS